MRTSQQFSITLSNELAAMVEAKVAVGEYASESEVIRDGLRLVLARDRVLEEWLRHEMASRCPLTDAHSNCHERHHGTETAVK
jgi:putative addiction module CopG family antidote